MSSKPRRQFTPEQKAEAVRIVAQSGKPISQIAKEMGLTESARLCCKNFSKTNDRYRLHSLKQQFQRLLQEILLEIHYPLGLSL